MHLNGHQFTFTCKYPLADQTISTATDFTVSGSDTTDSATGIGTLNYALTVDAGAAFAIGNMVTATITPGSSGLVTATILGCEVTNSDLASENEVSIIKSDTVPCSTECPDGWREFTLNGKSSCLKNTGKSAISSAAAKCASIGAHLPMPLNQQHNAQMQAAFESLGLAESSVALGGNDVDEEDQWRTADGTAVQYFNWFTNQPDDWKNNEDYVMMSLERNGQWIDVAGSNSNFNIVCEQDKCHSLKPTCDLGVTITTGQGDSTLGFTWNSFKWSTTMVGNSDVVENQEVSCSISLAKTPATVTSQTCA